jgi:predicted transcriptional regulator of viral defense system
VFSHETALVLHGLSDAMPGRMYLTLPLPWGGRRLRVPKGVVLAFASVPKDERTWVGPLPVTSVSRSLLDCAAVHTAPDILAQAVEQARERGLVSQRDADRALGRPEANP